MPPRVKGGPEILHSDDVIEMQIILEVRALTIYFRFRLDSATAIPRPIKILNLEIVALLLRGPLRLDP